MYGLEKWIKKLYLGQMEYVICRSTHVLIRSTGFDLITLF
jgi:hypothetical protein